MLYQLLTSGFWCKILSNSNCCSLYWKHCFPLFAFKTVFPTETLVMRILDLLELSHRYLKICLFFSIYFLSFVQLDNLYWSIYTDLYWSIELLVYWIFLIISVLLLSPSKLIFFTLVLFFISKTSVWFFLYQMFLQWDCPSIYSCWGFCSDFLVHDSQ